MLGSSASLTVVHPIFGKLRSWQKDNVFEIIVNMRNVAFLCFIGCLFYFIVVCRTHQCDSYQCIINAVCASRKGDEFFSEGNLLTIYTLVATFLVAVSFEDRDRHKRAFAFFVDVSIGLTLGTSVYLGFYLFEQFFAYKQYVSGVFHLSGIVFLACIITFLQNNQISKQLINSNDNLREEAIARYQNLRPVSTRTEVGIGILGVTCVLIAFGVCYAITYCSNRIAAEPYYAVAVIVLLIVLLCISALVVHFIIDSDVAWFSWKSSVKQPQCELLIFSFLAFVIFVVVWAAVATSVLFIYVLLSGPIYNVFPGLALLSLGVAVAVVLMSGICANCFFFNAKRRLLKNRIILRQKIVGKNHFDIFVSSLMKDNIDNKRVDYLRECIFNAVLYVSYESVWAHICYPLNNRSYSVLPFLSFSASELRDIIGAHKSGKRQYGRAGDCFTILALMHVEPGNNDELEDVVKRYLSIVFDDDRYMSVNLRSSDIVDEPIASVHPLVILLRKVMRF